MAAPIRATAPGPSCPVNSHNEWDPLEEVVLGSLERANVPSSHVAVTFNVPRGVQPLFRVFAGRRYPGFLVDAANRELRELERVLAGEGVVVRRPSAIDFHARYATPHWASRGFCASCPRDSLLVIGDEIIETPMAWRSRYFETFAYRRLLKEYFARGARWTSAPKPELPDALFEHGYREPAPGEPMRYVVNEHEPVFDAADFVRCGRDLLVTRSNVTNHAGIEWLRRHLGPGYAVHEIESRCRQPMHIDSTILPLAPGKLLVNPDYIDPARLPAFLRRWDVLVAPEPDPMPGWVPSMCSKWISLNVLMLDPRRVIVERSQTTLIRALRDWGFEPIPCTFARFAPFGGSFHCATLDVRRRGSLESYR